MLLRTKPSTLHKNCYRLGLSLTFCPELLALGIELCNEQRIQSGSSFVPGDCRLGFTRQIFKFSPYFEFLLIPQVTSRKKARTTKSSNAI
jgi:hypothetical protein